jgi:hypothetical protein
MFNTVDRKRRKLVAIIQINPNIVGPVNWRRNYTEIWIIAKTLNRTVTSVHALGNQFQGLAAKSREKRLDMMFTVVFCLTLGVSSTRECVTHCNNPPIIIVIFLYYDQHGKYLSYSTLKCPYGN